MELNEQKRKAAELEEWQFEQLPDEMFAEVLSNLPLPDRFRDIRVSKRWQNLMSFKDIVVLDITAVQHKKQQSGGNRSLAVTEDILQAILPKIGGQLKLIILRSSWWRISIDLLDLITQYCPELIGIDLGNCDFGLPLAANPLLQRLNQLNLLQSIAISNKFSQRNEVLLNWLNHSTTNFHLKQLKLSHFDFTEFQQIPVFPHVPTVELPQLKKLSLIDCKIGYNSIQKICNNCPLIESLEIINCNTPVLYKPISQLENLSCLVLERLSLSEEDFDAICTNCARLVEVKVNQVSLPCLYKDILEEFRPTDLTCIKKIPRLRTLVVTNEQGFDDSKLLLIAASGNLESFETDSVSVTHVSVTKLISNCSGLTNLRLDNTQLNNTTVSRIGDSKNLRHVRLTNCNITPEGFVRLTKKRQRNSPVNLLTITTDIQLSQKLLKHLQAVKVHLQFI